MRRNIALLSVALLIFGSSVAFGASTAKQTSQDGPADPVSGKYEGIFKNDQAGDAPVTMYLKNDNGKLSGKIDSAQGSFPITGGTLADGKIAMTFKAEGDVGTINATISDDKINGRWDVSDQSGLLELKKARAAPRPSAGGLVTHQPDDDPITGEWDAIADANGQPFPFFFRLKLEGDKVTGSSESQLASAPISNGTWDGNKLTFSIDGQNGSINMNAVLKDGKLVGEFEYAGQLTGKWEAKKK